MGAFTDLAGTLVMLCFLSVLEGFLMWAMILGAIPFMFFFACLSVPLIYTIAKREDRMLRDLLSEGFVSSKVKIEELYETKRGKKE